MLPQCSKMQLAASAPSEAATVALVASRSCAARASFPPSASRMANVALPLLPILWKFLLDCLIICRPTLSALRSTSLPTLCSALLPSLCSITLPILCSAPLPIFCSAPLPPRSILSCRTGGAASGPAAGGLFRAFNCSDKQRFSYRSELSASIACSAGAASCETAAPSCICACFTAVLRRASSASMDSCESKAR